MQAEIISIGDEITSGQTLDTNSQWLAERLGELGVRVLWHTTVGDELEANVGVFSAAVERANVVVATGGLGPTADDLTREALARTTGRELVRNDEALEHIKCLYARRRWPMPPRNEVQALFPEGSRMIPNPTGTAPGIAMTIERAGRRPCHVFALPGVPGELKEMWPATVVGLLREAGAGRRVRRHRRIKCFGAGESNVEAMLPELIRRDREPRVGITASQTTIILRITAEADTEAQCLAAMGPTVATIRECLGELVFGEEDEELQDVVVRLLAEQNKTLAVVEWGTEGLVAHGLASADKSGRNFLGGLVVTNLAGLHSALGQSDEVLEAHPPTSRETAAAMAAACRARFGADYALSVGPLAEASSDGKVPPVFLALASESGVHLTEPPMINRPALRRVFYSKWALNVARLVLLRTDRV
ncbi:MAG: CinA family nicotinamide mononucleotide deamidase-related protein [Pirellulales bacterium]|nr:CinA family nicotinamide mononucleotide deamidase-related protein [Pirellulales bacterium]